MAKKKYVLDFGKTGGTKEYPTLRMRVIAGREEIFACKVINSKCIEIHTRDSGFVL